jgi:hypothetical protein
MIDTLWPGFTLARILSVLVCADAGDEAYIASTRPHAPIGRVITVSLKWKQGREVAG